MGKRTKLTDKEKKKIIADFSITQNKSETARMNKTTITTVNRLLDKNKDEVIEKVNQKKEENTKDILTYIDNAYEDQKEVIRLSLQALKEKLKKPDAFTNVKDIATVYGIMSDKALKSKELKIRESEISKKDKDNQDVMNKLDTLLEEQKNA